MGAEHLACRSSSALFDETSFAKIDVSGPGASAFLQWLCDNDVDRPVGTVTYTSMLNTRGGIECDFTVTRVAEDRFRIVTGTAFGQHDLAWIRSHAPDDGTVTVADVTSAYACLGLWGPAARSVLQPLTEADLSNEAFRYMRAVELAVGPVPCLALRVTYVGELGWELYCPMEFGLRLWDVLWEAGRPHGLVAGGYRAIHSMRLEKGYRVWGSDITPDVTPYQAGLGFAVKLDKGSDFIGRDALVAAKDAEPGEQLACLVLDDPRSVALGEEPARVDGRIAGRVTSGGFGYTVGRSIAYAYLPPEHASVDQPVDIEIFGEWIAGRVAREPLFGTVRAPASRLNPPGRRIRTRTVHSEGLGRPAAASLRREAIRMPSRQSSTPSPAGSNSRPSSPRSARKAGTSSSWGSRLRSRSGTRSSPSATGPRAPATSASSWRSWSGTKTPAPKWSRRSATSAESPASCGADVQSTTPFSETRRPRGARPG